MLKSMDLKGKKGITILALSVTIIILLILAGISISMLTGDNGLIKNAGNAKEQAEIDGERECVEIAVVQAMGKDKYGDVKKDKLKEELDNIAGKDKTNIIESENHLTIEFKDSGNYYSVNKDGEVEKYNYQSSLEYYIKNGEIKVGDYFEYKIKNYKNDGLYIVSSEKSGYTEEQHYDVKSYQGEWRVLYNGIDENGLQIVSCENVLGDESNGTLSLMGKEGYNNAVEILNNMAGNYIEEEYAQSARSLGSNPADTQNSIGNVITIKDVKEQLSSAIVWDLVQDEKWLDENYKYDETQLANFKTERYKVDIFYASRYIYKGYHYGGDADFCVRKYYYSNAVVSNETAVINNNGNYEKKVTSGGLIPVIRLRENIQVDKTEEEGKVIWKIKE